MTREKLKLTSYGLILLMLASCGPAKKSGGEETSEQAEESQKYNVYVAPESQRYPDAQLSLTAPESSDLDAADSITFDFEVTNYELGIQTPDADQRGIANSGNGQHIHFIVDNDPYSAHYTSTFKKKFSEGKHVVLAFLSRSYHESVKESFVLQEFTVGNAADDESIDMSDQHLFYSRPKGTYSGSDTEKLMLDFFLVNTSISESGNKVRATINGEEHMLTEWAPYFIEGLEKGTVTIKLELIDSDGNLIPGPYNSVTRTVTLE